MADDSQRKKVPLLFVKGTHYEVGFQVGQEFRAHIQEYISCHPYRETMLSWYKEKEGREFCNSLLATCRAKYPHYVEELKGLAAGAQIPLQEYELLHLHKEYRVFREDLADKKATLKVFDHQYQEERPQDFEQKLMDWVDLGCTDLMLNDGKKFELLHLEKEIVIATAASHMIGDEVVLDQVQLGCSDLLLNDGKQIIIGHNMDYYNKMADTLYVVCAHILPYKSRAGREFPEEKFVTMSYPGFLFGGNCSFNQHGLVYALGATYPRDTGPSRVPELFLRRHFLSATSPADAMRILENVGGGCATGFAMHFGFINSKQSTLWSSEVGPSTDEKKSELSVITVSPDADRHFYSHTNHYQHLRISHYIGASSAARKNKVDDLPVPEDMDGIRAILGNTDNATYPVYKSPTVSKQQKQLISCVYTGIFDLKARQFYLYLDNPAAGGPVMTLSLDMF